MSTGISHRFRSVRGIAVGLVFLVLCAIAVAGIARLEIDPNNRVFFSNANPRYAAFEELEDRFGTKSVLLFLISAKDRNARVDWRDSVGWLERQAQEIPSVVSVTSLGTLQRLTSDDSEIDSKSFLDAACGSDNHCDTAALKEVVPESVVGRLVSKDFRSLAVIASLSFHEASPTTVEEVSKAAEEIKSEFKESYPGLDLHLTGAVPLMSAFFRAALSDSLSLFPITIAILIFVLWMGLGSIPSSLVVVGTAALAAVLTIGGYGWLGVPLNSATAVAPLVTLTVVVVTILHPFSAIAQLATKNGQLDKGQAYQALARLYRPMILSALSTAVGFFSIVTVSSPPLVHLGVLCGFGTLLGCGLGLFFLAVSLRWTPWVFIGSSRKGPRGIRALVRAISGKPQRNRAIFVAGISCLLSLGLSKASFDEDFIDYFPADSSFSVDTRIIGERLSGLYQLEIVVDSGVAEGVFLPRTMGLLRNIQFFLSDQDSVVSSSSLIDVIDSIADVVGANGDAESIDAAQLYFLNELGGGSAAEGWSMTDPERRYARVSVVLAPSTMGEIRELVERIEDWSKGVSSEGEMLVTGEGVPTAYLSKETIFEMFSGVAFGLVFCAAGVGLIFRRLGVAFIMVLCSTIPLAAGFGVWSAFGGDFGMGVSLVVATTIGLVIDDAIHFCSRFFGEEFGRSENALVLAAVCVEEVAPAMVLTSIALVMGFSVLLISEFKLNYMFGMCTILVVIWSLIFNLTVTPFLMAWFQKRGSR